ncbi:MAG: DUF3662 and FHA domain-containing protein [Actinomycetota bacterium]
MDCGRGNLRPVGLRSIERRLERFVDGAVGRFFRGGVRPVEIGHRIAREMADSRSVGVKGQPVVANHFEVGLADADLARFADVEESLVRELCDAARQTARDEGWQFMGPVQVVLSSSASVRGGQMAVTARMKEADGAAGVLHLSNGQQVVLGEYRLTLGRLPECTITFDDTNVSREHAEIRPDGDGFVIADLGSTNGTSVNGAAISQRRLDDGDVVSLGGTTSFEFRAG